MITLVNGVHGGELSLFKGADTVLNLMLLADGSPVQAVQPGSQLDLTGDTITVEVYTDAQRSVAATATHACALGTVTAGAATCTIANAAMTYGPGLFYLFVKRVENTGTTTEYSNIPTKLTIK
jgi:hypothetical protein